MTKLNLSLIVIGLLVLSTVITWGWGTRSLSESQRKLQLEVRSRIQSWWVMSAVFLVAWCWGFFATVVLFFILSGLALREYMTLIATKRADHRALFWAFIILTPIQYYLIGIRWYGLFSIFIPVYGFLLIMTRVAMSGDCDDFLERVAKIHWGLMTCVFLLSHAPALLTLEVVGFAGREPELLFYLIVLTELSDILQFISGKLWGKHKIAPAVSPNKTVEGLIGGMCGTALCAALLSRLTLFSLELNILVGALICLFGFCGGLCMSAIKRDHGCKDFGAMIPGHGGILDRVDSLCFTAPLYFHFVRYYFTA